MGIYAEKLRAFERFFAIYGKPVGTPGDELKAEFAGAAGLAGAMISDKNRMGTFLTLSDMVSAWDNKKVVISNFKTCTESSSVILEPLPTFTKKLPRPNSRPTRRFATGP